MLKQLALLVLAIAGWGMMFADAAEVAPGQPPLRLEQFYHTAWTARDGAPRDVHALAEGDDGTLWIGTSSGIYNFNGLTFSQPDLRSDALRISFNAVGCLLGSRDGSLWAGFSVKGIAEIRQQRVVRYFDERSGLPIGEVRTIVEAPDGRLVAVVGGRLLTLDGSRWRPFVDREQLHGENVTDVRWDKRGALWIATDKSFWSRTSEGSPLTRVTDGGPIGVIVEGPQESVWGTSGPYGKTVREIRKGSDDQSAPRVFDVGPENARFLFDHDERLWIPGLHGLRRYALEDRSAGASKPGDTTATEGEPPLDRFSHADGMSSDGLTVLFQGSTGEIWIGTDKGLDRFEKPRIFTFFDTTDSGPDALAQCPDGTVWIGTYGKPLRSVGASGTREYGPTHNRFFDLACDPRGIVWLVDEVGFWKFESGSFARVSPPPGVPDNWIRKVVFDRAGDLFASTNGSTLWRRSGDVWALVNDAGLPPRPPFSMLVDHLDRLWLGYPDDRVALRDGSNVTVMSVGGEHAIGLVSVIAETRYGIVFGGSNGLAVYRDGQLQPVVAENAVDVRGITGVVESRDGDLWLNGLHGVVRVAASELAATFSKPAHRFKAYAVSEAGLTGPSSQGRPLPSALREATGRLWFATTGTLVYVDEQQVIKPVEPRLRAASISVDGSPLDADRRLARDAQQVRFSYFGVNLFAPEKVVYQYQLEGLDRSWQDAGNRTDVVYSHLPPGDYRFRVMASNGDGQWTAPQDTLPFNVPIPFYRTWWFTLLAATLLVLLAAATGYLITMRRNMAVRRSYEERAEERIRIARELHDTLLQGVQGLMLQFHAAVHDLSPREESRASMERALHLADELIGEGRDRVAGLRTAHAPGANLKEAFETIGRELGDRGAASLSVQTVYEVRALRPEVADELFFIGREALSNAFQHSKAANIVLRVEFGKRSVRLVVLDDGIGFDVGEAANRGSDRHWGLQGMAERTAGMRGVLTATSTNAGTTVTVEVPAPQAYAGATAGWIQDVSERVGLFGWPRRH